MMTWYEALAWTLIAAPLVIGGYAFVLYPAVVWVWSRFRPAPVWPPAPQEWPNVTILIVAYNEERRLPQTIKQALAADYPADRLGLLVVSDCSSDGTDELVRNYGDPRVRLLRMSERRGKAAGENASGAEITSDIVVSIDAAILIPRDSLKHLIRAMLDPEVGVASGRDLSVGDELREGNQAESSYVGLEMQLRHLETRVRSIVGASGCFYAARRELHLVQFPETMSRDFAAASNAVRHGFRAVSVDDATCLVPRARTLRAELRRKSRTMERGLETLLFMRGMMNPFRYGSFSFMMVSHKLLRWLLFPSFLGWIIGPILLVRSAPHTSILLIGMLVGIALGVLASRWPEGSPPPRIVAIPGYVFVSIMAGWLAWWQLFRGHKSATWEPTRRPEVALPGGDK